ncbi:hypothetical protein CCHR01_13297 [Colletotrichum chrysophilum]|uniref:Uncharacterized protein n=1 Tax=Colletotrichum chrysophilum TaxID=1836956 RepID=A0AAD9A9L5_9PEZI|nr:hypothetical protein CCHR01_13297 [Colletotrichum chrysophilum]
MEWCSQFLVPDLAYLAPRPRSSASGSGSGSGRDDSRTFTTPFRQESFFNAARLTRTWWWDGSTKRHPPPYEYLKLPKPPSTSRTATKGHAVIAFWKNARHRQTSPAETSPAHHPLPFDKSSRFSNLNRVCLLHWILHPRHHRQADMSGYTTSEIQHTRPLQMFMYFDGRTETALNEHMLSTLPWGNLASSSDCRKFMSELPTDPTIKATFEEGPVLLRPHTVHRPPASWPTVHDPWAPTVPTRLATRTARKSWKKIVRFKMGEPRARGESSACQVSPGGPIHAQCDMIRQDGPLGSGLCPPEVSAFHTAPSHPGGAVPCVPAQAAQGSLSTNPASTRGASDETGSPTP